MSQYCITAVILGHQLGRTHANSDTKIITGSGDQIPLLVAKAPSEANEPLTERFNVPRMLDEHRKLLTSDAYRTGRTESARMLQCLTLINRFLEYDSRPPTIVQPTPTGSREIVFVGVF